MNTPKYRPSPLAVMLIATIILCVVRIMTGCAFHRRYQTCLSQQGDMVCLRAQDHQGADMKALVINAQAQGAATAWVQKEQPKEKQPKGKQKKAGDGDAKPKDLGKRDQ